MRPTIAVVIPNRNDAVPLQECLASVLQQEDGPDQIIVVDDQSTDDSRRVIKQRLYDVPNARLIINSERLGTMGALNVGLHHAETDYILFLSSNDFLGNGIFKHARASIHAHGYPGVWSAMVWAVDKEGKHRHLYPSPVISMKGKYLSPETSIRLALSVGHWFTGTTLIYHRQALNEIGGFDTGYQGLADMFAALTLASLKGAFFAPEPYGVMRQHSGGLMWRTSIDLPGLDKIIVRMKKNAPKLSPRLYTPEFCELMERRIRFTAIRAFEDNRWQSHGGLWTGRRYKLLIQFIPMLGNHRRLQLIVAFVLLRPLSDAFYIVRYRYWRGAIIQIQKRWLGSA